MRDDDDVQVIPGDVLVGKVSEHGGDERCCSVVHIQTRLSLRESGRVGSVVRLFVSEGKGGGKGGGSGLSKEGIAHIILEWDGMGCQVTFMYPPI